MLKNFFDFLQAGSDYVYFFYGLSFLFLGFVSFFIRRDDAGFDWKWMGWFGLLYGAQEWLEFAGMFFERNRALEVLPLALVVVACFLLFEFCRRYLPPAVSKKYLLAYGILFVLFVAAGVSAGASLGAFKVFSSYFFRLPSGLLTACVFLDASKKNKNGALLRWLFYLVLLYAFSSCLDVPSASFFPARYLNEEVFYRLTGFSHEFLRGVLAFAITAVLLTYLQEKMFPGVRHRWVNCRTLFFLEAVVLTVGCVLTNRLSTSAELQMRLDLLNRVRAAAAVIDHSHIKNLTGSASDLDSDHYRMIKEHLTDLKEASPDLRHVYLLGSDHGGIFFFTDSEHPRSSLFSPPGRPYSRRIGDELREMFDVGKPFIEFTPGDAAGGMTAFASVKGEEKRGTLAVLGMDADGRLWRHRILMIRLEPILVTLVIAIFMFVLFFFYQFIMYSNISLSRSASDLLEAQRLAHIGNFNCDLSSDKLIWSQEAFLVHGIDAGHGEPPWSKYAVLVYPDDALRFKKALGEAVGSDGSDKFDIEYRIVRKDGAVRYVRLEGVVQRGTKKKAAGFSGTIQDVTDMKKTEGVLMQAKEEAEAASRAKNLFLAKMSHEIRTPMNAIMGFSALLQKTPLDALQKEYLTAVLESGENLVNIITDILDISKIESGRITLESSDFNLEYLLESLIKIVGHKIERSRLDLHYEFDPAMPKYFRGDPTRLRQIILNLLTNAIKFTEQGSIVVHVASAGACLVGGEKGQTVVMTVRDTGIGIPLEMCEEIFKPFVQADATINKKYGGTGLGLAIAKGYLEAMGGDIRVESEVGKGASFFVTVCLKDGKPIADQDIRLASLADLAGKNVLIVDRDERSRIVLEGYCRDIGLSCVLLDTTTAGVMRWLDGQTDAALPDFIITDVVISLNEGFDLPKELKQNPRYRQIKIIAVTSEALPNTLPLFQNAGFNGYLTKPLLRRDAVKVFLAVLGDRRKDTQIVTRHTAEELALKGVKILVVEDNAVNRKLVASILGRMGCTLDEALNGQEAVEKTRAGNYDIILMDLEMPFMGGVEATRIIRQDLKKDIPIIGLTAAVMKEDEEKARAAGMNDFLTKPVDLAKLKKTLIVLSGRE